MSLGITFVDLVVVVVGGVLANTADKKNKSLRKKKKELVLAHPSPVPRLQQCVQMLFSK